MMNSPELEKRQKRSHLTTVISIDKDIPEALFQGSAKKPYITHLTDCTCKDFAIGHEKYPCKHILRLATELGLISPEEFQEGEDDYVMHADKTFNEHVNENLKSGSDLLSQQDGVFSNMTVIFAGKLLSLTKTAAEIRVRALGGRVAQYINERTSLVVVGEKAGKRKGTVLYEAESLGIKIIDESEFLAMCENGGSEALEVLNAWQGSYPSVKLL